VGRLLRVTRDLEVAAHLASRSKGLVFTRPDGSAIHPQTLSYLFEKRVQRAGLPMVRLHELRHSFASAALAAGEPPKVVQERLGHSTTTVTLDVYSHVTREVEEAAAHRIAASILGSRT
jgi:integrase